VGVNRKLDKVHLKDTLAEMGFRGKNLRDLIVTIETVIDFHDLLDFYEVNSKFTYPRIAYEYRKKTRALRLSEVDRTGYSKASQIVSTGSPHFVRRKLEVVFCEGIVINDILALINAGGSLQIKIEHMFRLASNTDEFLDFPTIVKMVI